MDKTRTIQTYVLYYDIFTKEESFASVVWDAAIGQKLIDKCILSGAAGVWMKRNGPLPKNHIYVVNVQVPTGIFWIFKKVKTSVTRLNP